MKDEVFIYINNDQFVGQFNELVPNQRKQKYFKLRFAKGNEWFSLSALNKKEADYHFESIFINNSDFKF